MRLLVDANLSPEVARRLNDEAHDAIHVADAGPLAATDMEITSYAATADRVVLNRPDAGPIDRFE